MSENLVKVLQLEDVVRIIIIIIIIIIIAIIIIMPDACTRLVWQSIWRGNWPNKYLVYNKMEMPYLRKKNGKKNKKNTNVKLNKSHKSLIKVEIIF